jgi:hypothetical protein
MGLWSSEQRCGPTPIPAMPEENPVLANARIRNPKIVFPDFVLLPLRNRQKEHN